MHGIVNGDAKGKMCVEGSNGEKGCRGYVVVLGESQTASSRSSKRGISESELRSISNSDGLLTNVETRLHEASHG